MPGPRRARVAPALSHSSARRRLALVAAGLAAALTLALAGGVVAGSRTPALDADELDRASLSGGAVLVSGVAHNTGAGVAHNVVVNASATLAGGLQGDLRLGDLAAGQTVPYEIRLPLADGQLASADYTFAATPAWDRPALDVSDHASSFSTAGGHVMVTETGFVKNVSALAASNVTLLWQNSADEGGKNVLGKASQNVGDVPAAGQVPFSLQVDLGGSPPADVWFSYDFSFDAGDVKLEQQAARRIGGTLTFSGALRNRGSVSAGDVSLRSALLDRSGRALAKGATGIGGLAAGARRPYTLTIGLGDASADDIQAVQVTLAWRQKLLYLMMESRSQSSTATLPGS